MSAWGYFALQNAHGAESASRRYVCVDGFVGMVRRGLHRVGRQTPRLFFARDHCRKDGNNLKDFLKDVAIAAGFWLIALAVLLCTALALHATKGGQSIRFLLRKISWNFPWILTSVTAGICEEVIFRGYFQRQFSAWTGNVSAGVLLSAAAFGVGHIYQGWRSAIIIVVYGLLFGILAEFRKSLRPGI